MSVTSVILRFICDADDAEILIVIASRCGHNTKRYEGDLHHAEQLQSPTQISTYALAERLDEGAHIAGYALPAAAGWLR